VEGHCIALLGEPSLTELAKAKAVLEPINPATLLAVHGYPVWQGLGQRVQSLDSIIRTALPQLEDEAELFLFRKIIVAEVCCGWVFGSKIGLEEVSIACSIIAARSATERPIRNRIVCVDEKSASVLARLPNCPVPVDIVNASDPSRFLLELECSHLICNGTVHE
jgi:hypothetical protein